MGFTTILLVLLMNGQSFGVQLSDSDKVESYIRDLIKRFEETPTDMMFSSVIHPPLIKDPSSKAAFFLPKVLLWSPQEHFVVPMKCPIHKKPLHPSMWTINVSGRKDYSEARLIYDIQGNVILVQRIYRCTEGKYGHKMRSTSLDVLCSLPSDIQAFCPIELFQRSGCTKRLLQYIETQIFQGENFLKISEGLAHLNFQEFCRMRNIYMTTAKEINENSTSARVDDFYKNVLFSFPSNDQIMNLYLNLFNKNKHLYEKDMENLKAAALSCDHTFKISRNIGLVRESDNKFITQFKQLFIVMNEKGEVVAWRLTTSTGFSEIQDLLYRLKLRLDKGDSKIEVICVDDCCRVRNKYHQIFPEAEVKLDLFHACQRVIRTMPITNSLYNDAVKSFIQIFRQDDDQGETRLKSTPEKDVIERNLNSFMQRWINVPSSPITSSTLTEIENLRSHISKGCLSDIPPGYGTEKNEYLHRLLNRSLITGATTISVEVAIALLTVFFYYHNKKITSLPHSCNKRIRPPVPIEAIRCPGEKPDCTGAQETDCSHLKATENKEKSTFQSSVGKRGIISDGEPFMVMADHIDDICNETVAGSILNAATKLQEMIENIDKKNNDRSFNALDLIYLSSFTDALALDGDTVVEDPTINSHLQILERQLAGFGLCVDEVQKDGDCAFRSVIRQFRKRARDDEIIANHDKLMQLPPDEDEATFALRQLFVDEITKESCETSQFLCGTSQEISRKASEFRIKGVFDREIGDVVMKTCANIIKIPIMVITSNQSIPYIPFLPDDALSSEPIYVAYHFYGAGHYDATDSMTYDADKPSATKSPTKEEACHCGRKNKKSGKLFCTSGGDEKKTRCPCAIGNRCCTSICKCLNCANRPPQTDVNNQSSCRCGANNKQKGEKIDSCTDTIGRRRTKCQCYKEMRPCTDKCGCYGCRNEYGIREAVLSNVLSPKTRKEKCTSSPSTLKRKRSEKFLAENNFEIKQGAWTLQETCLLEAVVSFLECACIVPSHENVTVMYNFVLTTAEESELSLKANCKSEEQIRGKMSYAKKRQTTLKRLLYGVAALD